MELLGGWTPNPYDPEIDKEDFSNLLTFTFGKKKIRKKNELSSVITRTVPLLRMYSSRAFI